MAMLKIPNFNQLESKRGKDSTDNSNTHKNCSVGINLIKQEISLWRKSLELIKGYRRRPEMESFIKFIMGEFNFMKYIISSEKPIHSAQSSKIQHCF